VRWSVAVLEDLPIRLFQVSLRRFCSLTRLSIDQGL
jgi:hypothetical protein